MKFIDFFAGIGGFHSGLEKAGMKCIGWCEFDKFAQKSYRAIYDAERLWFADDVRKVRGWDVPKADLWSFGFPCQDVSIAGKQKGIKRGTRSGLFFEIMRLIDEAEENRPEWLIAENVKSLLSIDGGQGFFEVLTEMGGGEGTLSNGEFTTQKITECLKTENVSTLLDVMESQPDGRYYLSEEKVRQLLDRL